MRTYSTTNMIERLTGLLDTKDLTQWEQEFVHNLEAVRSAGRVTSLTDAQVECLDKLHTKHFG